jgi:ribose transport system substrate-binding protein
MVSTFLSLDYWEEYRRYIDFTEAAFPGVKIEMMGPSDFDYEATMAAVDQAIAKGANGLLIQAWDQSLVPSINKAVDSGIPVVLVGVDYPESKRHAYVGTSNYVAGVKACDWLAEQIGGKGKIALMYTPTLANVVERIVGFKDTLEKKYPDIQIVVELDHQNDSNVGAQQIVGILQKNPDLAGIFAADGISGPASAMGIREAGVEKGSVKLLCFDREDALLAAIEEGEIAGSVAQGTPLEIYLGTMILDMINHNQIQVSYDDEAAGVTLVPEIVWPSVNIITKENVKYFRRNYAK